MCEAMLERSKRKTDADKMLTRAMYWLQYVTAILHRVMILIAS